MECGVACFIAQHTAIATLTDKVQLLVESVSIVTQKGKNYNLNLLA